METQEQSAVSASAGSQEPTKKTSGYGGFYTGMGPAREIDALVETPHVSLGDMKTQEMTSASTTAMALWADQVYTSPSARTAACGDTPVSACVRVNLYVSLDISM